ncbi:hypothetical protein DB346_11955 [Verrucomicrobia bacterium LW23]|nr:hypothetical protein DB346_11955 [Verrucomicrobia bacterium LW23]
MGDSFYLLQLLWVALATLIFIVVDTAVLTWLGRDGFLGAVVSAVAGVVPFYMVVIGWFIALETPGYQKHVAWTMTMGLPLLALMGMMLGACVVKVVAQCWISGLPGGLACGVLLPFLCMALAGPGPSLWSVIEAMRQPAAATQPGPTRPPERPPRGGSSHQSSPELGTRTT